MRVLIIGATGLLGSALLEQWRSDEVVGATSKDADIRDEAHVQHLMARCKPDWTVLAAAYTDVDGCERNPELAEEVNCIGAGNVARAARESCSRFMLISTDYVFDGSQTSPYEPHHPTRPINVYGRSKAAGEAAVREILDDWCIVRTSWLYGTAGKCFPATILSIAEAKEEISVVADQFGSPTYNRDLANSIIKLVQAGATGIIHATNAGACSRFEFALEILRAKGMEKVRVNPITTEESNCLAPRPRYSVLSDASLRAYGLSMRPWRAALQAYIGESFRSPKPTEKLAFH